MQTQVLARRVNLNKKPYYIVVGRDISSQVAAEGKRIEQVETIKHMAYFDPLTDIPNRNNLHDYIYQDNPSPSGRYVKGDAKSRLLKLDKFKKTFGLSQLFYEKKVAGYLLVFLSVDSLDSPYLAQMSSEELSWLKDTLKKNSTVPTIIFFHVNWGRKCQIC